MNRIVKWAMTLLVLRSGGALAQVPAANDTSDGNNNTGMGGGALGGPAASNDGFGNTAVGFQALFSNAGGMSNTASGVHALGSNTIGSNNTAIGMNALILNTSGAENTASGVEALKANTMGNYNTASGFDALNSNTTGSDNTASGAFALEFSTGDYNTASGAQALQLDVDGYSNTASGVNALYSNTGGIRNIAAGQDALFSNTIGNNNTAIGVQALNAAIAGSNNIAVGFQAGLNLTTGSGNIEIGNVGAAADSKVIKIGTEGAQKKTYIAGIYGNTAVDGLAVVVGSSGELGSVSSSDRFKTDIAPMGSSTARLRQLRPVTFHYKADLQGRLRYGLIAEEVAKVYPELVVRDDQGRIDGVRYDELAPMLLNELQKQQTNITRLDTQHQADAAKIALLEQHLAEIRTALAAMQSKDQLVAQR